jgi:hypothetical protein
MALRSSVRRTSVASPRAVRKPRARSNRRAVDLLNVAALAVELGPLGAIGKDEDRVGGAGKSGRAAHGV